MVGSTPRAPTSSSYSAMPRDEPVVPVRFIWGGEGKRRECHEQLGASFSDLQSKSDEEMPRELTGITLSKQMLKFFFWLALSFFKETRVSPINSLWPNLSSSHTEILEGREGWRAHQAGCSNAWHTNPAPKPLWGQAEHNPAAASGHPLLPQPKVARKHQ